MSMKTLFRRTIPLVMVVLLLTACASDDDKSTVLWYNSALVTTRDGPVQAVTTDNGVWEWKAIPYAAPPVGELRWKAPRDATSWTAAPDNAEFSDMCPQYDFGGDTVIGSEDCLYLNVWRPQSSAEKLPVYVWIHGGGNSSGSADLENYRGANLALRSDVVFVSMNYRLGPLGWFLDESLFDGDPDTDSGNFGTLDIIKSLEWIRDNIAQFGGDPDNVIITGESAGGINVLSLLVSPRAEGLFDKAMSQSGLLSDIAMTDGTDFTTALKPSLLVQLGMATDEAQALQQLSGLSADDVASTLRSATPADLLNVVPSIGLGLLSMPNIFPDGHVIVENGVNSFAAGNYPNKVPTILGTNSGDVRLFLYVLNGATAEDPPLFNAVADIGGQLWKAAGADDIARAMVSHADQPDVFVYSFEWGRYRSDGTGITPAPWNYFMGSAHSLDITFFLDTQDSADALSSLMFTEENRSSRELLSDAMIDYLQGFAREGVPVASADLPVWEPWSNTQGSAKSMVLNADLSALQLGMVDTDVSLASALASIDSIDDEDLRQRVDALLHDFVLSCALISENPAAECN